MRIISICVTVCSLVAVVHSADEHRPKKKEKRQSDYGISNHYNPYNFRLERRIPNGPSLYSPSQYYPGSNRLYRKGRPHSIPAPPYAVRMEPLIHYSQRDPLYDTNTLSPNTDPSPDLADGHHGSDPIDRGGSGDTIYIPHKPLIKYVEKPVYIKEPEPIIEIIIKESNVTLPPPPTEAPPPPQKKKKEEVQVFYVKYKKNPNGYGKDAVIYDKPIPAISPAIPDDENEPQKEEEWNEAPPTGYGDGYSNDVIELPKPTTTLRTIIKPDSEVYHSPGNDVKVTFGKEGFDYDKRSSKPEEYSQPLPSPPLQQQEEQVPRARQLSSFSDVYFRRSPPPNYYPSGPEFRAESRPAQSYRPFNNFPPSANQYNNRSPNREYNSRPPSFSTPSKYPFQNPPYTKPETSNYSPSHPSRPSSYPNFSHSISHPPPPQFQLQSKPGLTSSYQPTHRIHSSQFSEVLPPSQRKPVPYTPFENLRPSQNSYPQTPATQQLHQSFNKPPPTQSTVNHQPSPPQPSHAPNIQFRPETHLNTRSQVANRPTPGFAELNNNFKSVEQTNNNINQYQQTSQQPRQTAHQHFSQAQFQQQQNQQQGQYQEHLNNLRTAQNVLPPGGELVHSLPKYEQHLFVDPTTGKLTQSLPLQNSNQQHFNAVSQQDARSNKQVTLNNNAVNSNKLFSQYHSHNNEFANHHQISDHPNQKDLTPSTSRSFISSITTTTPKVTTTTPTTEKTSTTTQDSKLLEAQLPDEVPDDLRQQLLSSGILQNAQISILDYDKVGDIPLSALPPDQLANFYGAGGAQQIAAAGSEPVPQVAALTARKDPDSNQGEDNFGEESEPDVVKVRPSNESDGRNVEMKVVKYNPETEKGQKVQEAYISENATQVDPVILNDNSYNRYLPLKVNGTQFPIPNVPELEGKTISSVVVLAPISYDFSNKRQAREAKPESEIELIHNEPLKALLANPSKDNYNKFLENERKTASAKQSVILLVAGSKTEPTEKEIFMYDILSKSVSKLSGELSSAFVEAAEANSSDDITTDPASAQQTPIDKN